VQRDSAEKLLEDAGGQDIDQELAYVASRSGMTFVGAIFSKTLLLAYGIVAARVVGTKLLGIFYLGLSVSELIAQVGTLGLSNGIFRYIGIFYARRNFHAIRKTLLSVLKFLILIGVLSGTLLIVVSSAISIHWFHQPKLTKVLILLAIVTPFAGLKIIIFSSLQSLQRIKYRVYVQSFILPPLQFAISVALFLIGWRLMALTVSYLASTIIGAGFASYYLIKVLRKHRDNVVESSEQVSMSQMMKFSLPLFASQFLTDIPSNRLVIWLLGAFWSAEAVSIYGVANRLRGLGAFIFHSLSAVFAPMISGLYDTGQLKKLEKMYKVTTRWAVSLNTPVYILMIIFSRRLLNLYGEAFIVGVTPLIILCLGEIFNSGVGLSGYIVTMSGRSIIGLYYGMATALLLTVSNIIAIPRYGILGAAFAVAISVACVNLARLAVARYLLGIHPYDWNYIKLALAAGAASLGLFGFMRILPLHFPYDMMVCSMAFFIIYIGLLLVIGLGQEDAAILAHGKTWLYNRIRRQQPRSVL
jgi:O-antigen/teichoic acid export membrane protein